MNDESNKNIPAVVSRQGRKLCFAVTSSTDSSSRNGSVVSGNSMLHCSDAAATPIPVYIDRRSTCDSNLRLKLFPLLEICTHSAPKPMFRHPVCPHERQHTSLEGGLYFASSLGYILIYLLIRESSVSMQIGMRGSTPS